MNRIVPKLFDQALDANEVAKIDPAVAEKLEKFWMDHCYKKFMQSVHFSNKVDQLFEDKARLKLKIAELRGVIKNLSTQIEQLKTDSPQMKKNNAGLLAHRQQEQFEHYEPEFEILEPESPESSFEIIEESDEEFELISDHTVRFEAVEKIEEEFELILPIICTDFQKIIKIFRS